MEPPASFGGLARDLFAPPEGGDGIVLLPLLGEGPSEVAPGIPWRLVENVVGEGREDGNRLVVSFFVDEDHAERVLRLAEVGLDLGGAPRGLLGFGQPAVERRRGAERQVDEPDEVMRLGVLLVQLDGLLRVRQRPARIVHAHEEVARDVVLRVALSLGIRAVRPFARARTGRYPDGEQYAEHPARKRRARTIAPSANHAPA